MPLLNAQNKWFLVYLTVIFIPNYSISTAICVKIMLSCATFLSACFICYLNHYQDPFMSLITTNLNRAILDLKDGKPVAIPTHTGGDFVPPPGVKRILVVDDHVVKLVTEDHAYCCDCK